ncbi:MAG: U32 family peptidase [Candidatus Borkfalkiaceae bacterium]|nr:U32 family peptidase [Clostridia bacterium]MDY6224132.1 U32 family peptidase [Christensenellaceae bacterium]
MNVELLAPAGNFNKMRTAFYFGADAAYIGGKNFSLRAFSDNFTADELKKAIVYAHGLGKKIYVTANIFAKNADFSALADYFSFLQEAGADGAIVSDLGAMSVLKKAAPRLALHVSTQANATNKYAVKFYAETLGASRVILARELSLAEIAEIRQFNPQVELEAFVHGAMCISYSGRCLLSDYLDGRSSNRGACAQCCRWKYEIRALNPTDGDTGWLPLEEDGRGAYILNSKDLNMLSALNALKNAGVNSFKIEGRMKSEYYLATVVNAYRRAMDGGDIAACERELCAVAHRNYTKAYAFSGCSGAGGGTRDSARDGACDGAADGNEGGVCGGRTEEYRAGQIKGEYDYAANVLSYKNGAVRVEMRNRFKTGDTLFVLSPGKYHGKEFSVGTMRCEADNADTTDAKIVQGIYSFACPYPLSAGDILRRRAG